MLDHLSVELADAQPDISFEAWRDWFDSKRDEDGQQTATTLSILLAAANECIAGIFLMGDDDIRLAKQTWTPGDTPAENQISLATRGNVILELGMFLGAQGPGGIFILTSSASNVSLPTDLAGITFTQWNQREWDENRPAAAVRRAVLKIKRNLDDRLASITAAKRTISDQGSNSVATGLAPSGPQSSRVGPSGFPDGWVVAARRGSLQQIAEGSLLEPGAVVVHATFGIGVVEEHGFTPSGDDVCSVKFSHGPPVKVTSARLFQSGIEW